MIEIEEVKREELFFLWMAYRDKLSIFNINEVYIYELAAIVQNNMIITRKELKGWYNKALLLKKTLCDDLKKESIILKDLNNLIKRTLLYFIRNKKVRDEK